MDGQHDATRVFGFGIIAIDPLGKLVAAAQGNPPAYVSTIAQAEAHALAVVLENTMQHKEILADCQSNVTLLQSGMRAALDPRRRSARTWTRISNAVDGETSGINLRWIPAHCSWQQVRRRQQQR